MNILPPPCPKPLPPSLPPSPFPIHSIPPPWYHKTYHISLCLPYSNSLMHPTYIINTLWSTPFIWIQIRFWSFGVSLPKLPLILMGSIVLLLPPSIHIQCPDAIIALLRVFQEKLIKSPTPTSLVPLLSYQFPSHLFPFPSPPLPPTSSSSSSHPEY